MMNKKAEILNDMLKKGYISQEEYQKKLLDDNFSDIDAATFHHIAKAYAEADETSYPISLFRRKYAKWLA